MQQDKVTIQPIEKAGSVIDTTVAAADITEGDVVLRVPEDLVVTLNRWATLWDHSQTLPSMTDPTTCNHGLLAATQTSPGSGLLFSTARPLARQIPSCIITGLDARVVGRPSTQQRATRCTSINVALIAFNPAVYLRMRR